jgi:hypothetical protein
MPVISSLRVLRQEDCKFKASVGYLFQKRRKNERKKI